LSSWARTLDHVARVIQLASIEYRRVDGKTSPFRCYAIIEEFIRNNKTTVLLITTNAMQNYRPFESRLVGPKKASSTRIIIVEPQWNPAVERDAIEKSIGAITVLGEEQQVYVTRYVVEDSIEQVRLDLSLHASDIPN
jgi:SNF2 family DNA or RNA helicase